MANARAAKGTRSHNPSYEATRAAYEDALNGFDFHPNYDSWPENDQVNYEKVRLWVANVRAAGLPVPAWRPGVRVPLGLMRANDRATVTVGECLPPRRPPAGPR